MMNTTDSQRGAIIGELEEMLAQSQSAGIQRGPSFEVGYTKPFIDRDDQLTCELIKYAELKGFCGSACQRSPSAPSTAAHKDSDLFDIQLEVFLQSLHGGDEMDLQDEPEDEDDGFGPRERTAMLHTAVSPLAPFFDHLKIGNNALFHLISSLSTGQDAREVAAKGLTRKDKKRERRGKGHKLYSRLPKLGGVKSKIGDVDDKKALQERTAIGVVQALASGNAANYLSIIALLLVNMKDCDFAVMDSQGVAVGNVLAALFGDTDKANPFRPYLQQPSQQRPRSKSASNSEMSVDDHSHDEGLPQMSDTGSTLAERGAESPSLTGDEPLEDDALAQALAMSMNHNSDDISCPMDDDEADGASADCSSASIKNVLEGDADCLPAALPMSTLGPFCNSEFRCSLYGEGSARRIAANEVPLRHLMIAMLTALNISVDRQSQNTGAGSSSQPPFHLDQSYDDCGWNAAQCEMDVRIDIASSAEAFATSEFLVEHIKSAIVLHSYNYDRSLSGCGGLERLAHFKMWHVHYYFLVWSLHAVLRVLKALFEGSILMEKSLASMLFRNILPTESDMQSGAAGLRNSLSRLRLHILDISGLKDCGFGTSIRLFEMKYPTNLLSTVAVEFMSSKDAMLSRSIFQETEGLELRFNLAFGLPCFIHTLRLASLETLASSIKMYFPDASSRLQLLGQYLDSSPLCPKSLETFSFTHFLVNLEQTVAAKNDGYLSSLSCSLWQEDCYSCYFLQSLCLQVLNCDECLQQFFVKMTTNTSMRDCAHAVIPPEEYRSECSGRGRFLKDLQRTLLRRFNDSTARNETNVTLFVGEMYFLRCLQLLLHEIFCLWIERHQDAVGSRSLGFCNGRCHPSLVVSEDMKLVCHVGPKVWATVVCFQPFKPNSGKYEWAVQVDKCTKGHVFLGLATGDANTEKDAYLGMDKHGWGLIGTRSLWHNKGKVVNDYGSGFGSASVVYMVYDSNAGTLSFRTHDSDWGVAFESLPKVLLFPAASLHENEDQISLLYCEKLPIASDQENDNSEVVPAELTESRQSFVDLAASVLSSIDHSLSPTVQSVGQVRPRSHPFVVTLLPSLCAFFTSARYSALGDYSVAMQLFPTLLVVARKLAVVSEHAALQITDSPNDTIGNNMRGAWMCSMSGAAATQYNYQIMLGPELALAEGKETTGNQSAPQSVALTGTCTAGNSLVGVLSGFVHHNRVKIVERWASVSHRTFEGRLSFCSTFMHGRLHDHKTGKVTFVECYKVQSLDIHMATRNVLNYSAIFATLAAGKLCSAMTANAGEACMPNIMGNVEEITPSTVDPIDENAADGYSISQGGEATTDVGAPHARGDSLLLSVLSSDLLSSGLKLTARNSQLILDCVAKVVPFKWPTCVSPCTFEDSAQFYQGSWCTAAFPLLTTVSEGASVDEEVVQVQQDSEESVFYHCLSSGKGSAGALDDYVSLYVGHAPLAKLGGTAMNYTRKQVLMSMIVHSGCFPVCLAESKAIQSDSKQLSERPPALLLEVWRATQRVMERIIRLRQDSRLSYDIICRSVCMKAEFLNGIQASPQCSSLVRELEVVEECYLRSDSWYTEGGLVLRHKCSKLIADVVEFMINPLQKVEELHSKLVEQSAVAILRTAGYRSLALLLGKCGNQMQCKTLFASPASPALVASALTCLPFQFVKKGRECIAHCNIGEHYLQGLAGINAKLLQNLKVAFESVYEVATGHLVRSTWNGDRVAQSVALSAWNIVIRAEDHMFLNRLNLFRVLHTVLDDVRATTVVLSSGSLRGPGKALLEMPEDSLTRQLNDILTCSHKRLSQLVLTTIHCLAAQVASVRDSPTPEGGSYVLRRAHSGPDTLSKSLFDLMFAELSNAAKALVVSQISNRTTDSVCTRQPESENEPSLDGNEYICRILRLLRLVAESEHCQKLLSSPKWLSLLLAMIGFGTLGIQRRVLRLLHRLLVTVDPQNLVALVPDLFGDREVFFPDSVTGDDDFAALSGSTNSAQAILNFLCQCVSVVFPGQLLRHELVQKLRLENMIESLSAEALLLLRVLFGVPAWRTIILEKIRRDFSASRDDMSPDLLITTLASASVVGGYFERRRPGGFVTLRPLCLLGSSDNFATKLAAASHSCGMLVSSSAATNSVEVVLMERNVKVGNDQSTPSDIVVQHTLSLAGNLPIRAVRLANADVLPCADVPVVASLISDSVVAQLLACARSCSLPWLRSQLKHIDSDSTSCNSVNGLEICCHVAMLRALATCVQNEKAALVLLADENMEFFWELLDLSVEDSGECSLNRLEAYNDKFSQMLAQLDGHRPEERVSVDSAQSMERDPRSAPVVDRLSRSSADGNGNASSSPLRELVAMLSPYGASTPRFVDPNAQSNAIAQMLEMGLPREWCEFALRRCLNNVEMAINMCLEHGAEMDQLIAQESILDTARATGQTLTRRTLSSRLDAQGLRRNATADTGIAAPAGGERQSMVRQLLEMGFPPSWCARAIESNQSNLDAALGWILTHDEELMGSSKESEAKSEESTSPMNPSAVVFNPLSVVSGSCDIRQDLTCSTSIGGFPSVGCRSYPVSAGKWYYEVTLVTAGCVQVGWASTGFIGGADQGQGVGDDFASWAYDGWRSYLWHETSIEWGAKWVPGDVVGCAVDLDNEIISFFLNGCGEELSMGTAFVGLGCPHSRCGRLYPCASFNKNESIRFNFGGIPFNHTPPPGYLPFSAHVEEITSAVDRAIRLHSFEEIRLDKSSWMKRYFSDEESKSAASDEGMFTVVSGPQKVELKDVASVAGQLAILYCRVIVLRCLRNLSRMPDDRAVVSRFCSAPPERMRKVVALLRLLSLFSNRTKVYLSTMGILSPNQPPPQNLGSVFCAGGLSALEELRFSLLAILHRSLQLDRLDFVKALMAEIDLQVSTASSRDNIGASKPAEQLPSAQLAVWLTNLCVEATNQHLQVLFSDADKESGFNLLQLVFGGLLSGWSTALDSPVAQVKLCAVQLHCMLLQELQKNFEGNQCAHIVKTRCHVFAMSKLIDQQVKFLLDAERQNSPVFSEYLQSLMELSVTVVDGEREMAEYCPLVEQFADIDDGDHNWEALAGKMLIDSEGWQTWTGKIVMRAVPACRCLASAKARLSERQDLPPALLVGCKVARKKALAMDDAGSAHAEGESQRSRWLRESETLSASDSAARVRSLFERSSPTPLDNEIEKSDLGTVLSISTWAADPIPGGARVIRWDVDGAEETVRWGAEGEFDVRHVSMKNGKVHNVHPCPPTWQAKLNNSGFGEENTFAVIMRVRKPKSSLKPGSTVTVIVEWCDFASTVLATGSISSDGNSLLIVERKLLSGPHHSGWESLHGQPSWRAGSSFRLDRKGSDSFLCGWTGELEFKVSLPVLTVDMVGIVSLQQARLFHFDDKLHASNIVLSSDRTSISKGAGGSQGCALGDVGFSKGVHLWELKIEQADVGSVFVGVCERPADARIVKQGRWMGCGVLNNRTSYRTAASSQGERVQVYGDHFQTGDLVCVVLDLNKGTLSFFLDGMKYGEHIIAGMGTAFDGLVSQGVKPRIYLPMVGLSKSMDRVTITPRWLSTIGADPSEEHGLYKRASQLFSSWSIERTSTEPLTELSWIYREGWRVYRRFAAEQCLRTKPRCSFGSVMVSLDTSLRSCLQASVRLGLSKVLVSGDRITFSKSSGRLLDVEEHAVVLGSYNGTLWYHLDSAGSNTNALESNACWSMVPSDVEGFVLSKRTEHAPMSQSLMDLPLPRLPTFHSGFISVIHDAGAVMRDGLEIDTSEVICSIPKNSTLFAIEQRTNASNINRFLVFYSGRCGWISDRMRGGGEEVMIAKLPAKSREECDLAKALIAGQCRDPLIRDKLAMEDVADMPAAMKHWEQATGDAGIRQVDGDTFERHSISFEQYRELAASIDGHQPWSVEMDMQLSESISRHSSRTGLSPFNFSSVDITLAVEGSCEPSLRGVAAVRVIARVCLLSAANTVFQHALPFFQLTFPEERLAAYIGGRGCSIEVAPMDLSVSGAPALKRAWQPAFNWADVHDFTPAAQKECSWAPVCAARRLRSLRRLLFSLTKQTHWEAVVQATTVPMALHQDEYEDPKDIKLLRINRIKASQARLSAVKSSTERIKQSVFGQLHKEMRGWTAAQFRRSYVGKGHGGQRRAFKVKFLGEGVNDYGGPYRAVFEQIVDELQCDSMTTGGVHHSDRCLLPLLVPSPNRALAVGPNQDKFMLTTAPLLSPMSQELMGFFGKLVGTAVRHHLNLAVDLSIMHWRPLVRLPLALTHLQTVDSLTVKNIQEIVAEGMEAEKAGAQQQTPEEWQDLTFSCYLPDGTRIPLMPGGLDLPVTISNWRSYVQLMEQCRLQESAVMFNAFRDGIATVLPAELLCLFTAAELEHLVCGNSVVDIEVIKRSAEYEGFTASDTLVQQFWEVLEEMSNEDKTLFLRFVWARSRLPTSIKDLSMSFKLQRVSGLTAEQTDLFLPHAQTCFFSLALPNYSSKGILREKLHYAINNSPNMDADVRLHNAEGWADA